MKNPAFLAATVSLYLVFQVCPANAIGVKFNQATVNLASVSGIFNIDVIIASVTNLGGFEFVLSYPPEIMSIDDTSDVVFGPFLGSTGRTTGTLGPNIDYADGKLSFGAYSLGSQPGPNGTGVLSTITFTTQTKAPGILEFLTVKLVDVNGELLPVDTIVDANLTNSLYVESGGECGGNIPCHDTIEEAIQGATGEVTIKVVCGSYNIPFTLNKSIQITVQGGWNSLFTSQTANSTIIKAPRVTNGSIKLQNLIVRP